MRFGYTLEHSTAHAALIAATNKWQTITDQEPEGDGPAESPAAAQATEEESAALDAIMAVPIRTPMELVEKLTIIEDRQLAMNTDWPETLARIQRDLINISRPNASPKMVEAFNRWAATRDEHCTKTTGDEARDHALFIAETEAFQALLDVPCTTPGDFLVKSYCDLIDEVGGIPETQLNGMTYWPFQPNPEGLDNRGGTNDSAAQAARLRDLKDCDLGRCMIALGMVEFDAEMWIAQARRIGKQVWATIQPDDSDPRAGSRGLCFGFIERAHDRDMDDMLQYLMAGGLRTISDERCHAVADAIEANHPDLLRDYRTAPASEPVTA